MTSSNFSRPSRKFPDQTFPHHAPEGSAVGVRRPLLRGYFHAGAAIVAVFGVGLLLQLTVSDRLKQISLLIYGASSILLFAWSAYYHIGTWSRPRRLLMRRFDQAAIFVLIAGTYTPIVFNMLVGWWRVGLLGAVWGLAVLGTVVAAVRRIPRWVLGVLFMVTGWVALAALPGFVLALGLHALILPVLGGLLYTLGALVFAIRWPRLWPRIFGYHEVFHLATIAANAVMFLFILQYVVPFTRH